MKYEIKGTFVNQGETIPFHTVLEAQNEKMVREKTYAEMGSKQRIKRMYILIKDVEELKK